MNQACYSRDELLSFALGRLPDTLAEQVESHIDLCATCEETVAILDDATDSFLRELREIRQQEGEEPALPAECAAALDQLRQVDLAQLDSLASADETPMEELVLRDYELLEPLGIGGMGAVFRARHLRLEKLVAVKLLPERRMQDQAAVARFRREMRLIGQLNHPSIVSATDAGEAEGRHFLVMELVPGTDLGRLIRQTGPLPVADACELVRLAAIGMQHAHQRGIVHRDLKPSNLMLTTDGRLKILDLGLALLASQEGTVDELTTMGQLMGTLDYMAPEQFGDSHTVDYRVDVYSLAATLYKLIAGVAPYSGDAYRTPLQKLRGLATEDPISIGDRTRDLDSSLQALIHHGLHRDPQQRIASMQEFAEKLEPYCQGADLPALWQQRSEKLQALSSDTAKSRVHRRSMVTENDRRQTVPAASPSVKKTGFGWRGYWGLAVSLGGLALLGVILFLKTNHGTLKIESPRDDLQLQVLRQGQVHKNLLVSKGENAWSLGLGEYEVKFMDPVDDLTIENGKFTLRRGDEHLATIWATLKAQAAAATDLDAADVVWQPLAGETEVTSTAESPEDGPRYADKTFPQWREIFVNERSPNYRGQAAQAMLALADDELERTAIELIYEHTTQRERLEQFKNENTGQVNNITQLVSDFVSDDLPGRVYALSRFVQDSPKISDRLAMLLELDTPMLTIDRSFVS